jgi:catechol 2,3-dioxygenase-like lactoylglutathione lyase family enzyme
MTTTEHEVVSSVRRGGVPSRLHHGAYVTRDMEATRRFYEDIIGLPLIATWTEVDELFGKERAYCHCFFGLGDQGSGGALAFFQFATPEDQDEFEPSVQTSPFVHLALRCDAETQQGIRERLAAAGHVEPKVRTIDHGYCVSMYVSDELNRVRLEFTVDRADAEVINAHQLEVAHGELARWLGGDHTSNNRYRT